MIYGILILMLVITFCAWLGAKSDVKNTLRLVERYFNELDDERKWSDKMRDERNEAIKRCIELEKVNSQGAFSEWKIIECTDGKRDLYIEKDGIRLIFEDKKCIGWYKPNNYEAPTAEVID